VPEWFQRALRETDHNLIVYYNPHRKRWVVDRCTRNGEKSLGLAHAHTPECPRTNVMVVQDEGQYMPLCQSVIDEIRSKDSWRYSSVDEFLKAGDEMVAADEAARDAKIDTIYREASIDNKRQLAKAWDLYQRHDLVRINQ
jgi:hypothetical protein